MSNQYIVSVIEEKGRVKSYRSWFSSCVLSLFMAFDGGTVRCGGIVKKNVYSGGMSGGWRDNWLECTKLCCRKTMIPRNAFFFFGRGGGGGDV